MEQTPKHTRRADYIGIWWTLLGPGGVLVTIFTTLFGFFEPIAQYGWAAVVLSGFACAGIAVLILSAGMVAWRYFNPITKEPQSTPDESALAGDAGLSEPEIASLVDARLHEFLATKLRAEFITNAQHHAYDEKVADLADKVKDARTVADGAVELIDKRFGDTTIDINSLEAQIADLKRNWEAWTHQHCREQDGRFKNVDGGFRALGDREKLGRIAERIEERATWLLQSSEGKKLDWTYWEGRFQKWREELTNYGKIASHYLPDVPALIRDVPAEKLSGNWPESRDLFPNDDAMLAHRTATIIMRNFAEQHERVIACVEAYAFRAPSMKGIRED